MCVFVCVHAYVCLLLLQKEISIGRLVEEALCLKGNVGKINDSMQMEKCILMKNYKQEARLLGG